MRSRLREHLEVAGVVLFLVVAAALILYNPGAEDIPPTNNPGVVEAQPIAEEEQESEVVVLAASVLSAWSSRDLPYQEWWAGLRPLLTPGGQEAYAYTQPAKVPDLGDIEPSEMWKGPGGTTATVYFTTKEGQFGVDVSRADTDSEWRANRILFPDQKSVFA